MGLTFGANEASVRRQLGVLTSEVEHILRPRAMLEVVLRVADIVAWWERLAAN